MILPPNVAFDTQVNMLGTVTGNFTLERTMTAQMEGRIIVLPTQNRGAKLEW
jgi:hypothetical protein